MIKKKANLPTQEEVRDRVELAEQLGSISRMLRLTSKLNKTN